ncbi:MAG TPA: hypothetical protein DEP72_06670 [Clostridiales bacterium]|nr:MAG: hypothetical protein A2Y18_02585 [Clostridiales bacterium GWD2_32_19]HCC07822.1 hypothetical protein [Clostridiales bacterium]
MNNRSPVEFNDEFFKSLAHSDNELDKKLLVEFNMSMKPFFYDKNTGLLSRNTWPYCLDKIKNSNDEVIIVYRDMNNVKAINEQYGLEVGDRYIKFNVEMIELILKKGDSAYRFGGDEVVSVHKDNLKNVENGLRVLDTLKEMLNDGLSADEIVETIEEDYKIQLDVIKVSNLVARLKEESWKLSPVAVGYGEYKRNQDIKDFFDEIEERMYENKKETKKYIETDDNTKIKVISDKYGNIILLKQDENNAILSAERHMHKDVEHLVKTESKTNHSNSEEDQTKKNAAIEAIMNNDINYFKTKSNDYLATISIMIRDLVTRDPITGFYKKEFVDSFLSIGKYVSLIDMTELKKINDTDGHDAGDRYLKETANLLNGTLKPEDKDIVFIRMGGFILTIHDNLDILKTLEDNKDLVCSESVQLKEDEIKLEKLIEGLIYDVNEQKKSNQTGISLIKSKDGIVLEVWIPNERKTVICDQHVVDPHSEFVFDIDEHEGSKKKEEILPQNNFEISDIDVESHLNLE